MLVTLAAGMTAIQSCAVAASRAHRIADSLESQSSYATATD